MVDIAVRASPPLPRVEVFIPAVTIAVFCIYFLQKGFNIVALFLCIPIGVLTYLSFVGFRAAFAHLHNMGKLDSPLSSSKDIKTGEAVVMKGIAIANPSLQSPILGRDCAYFHSEIGTWSGPRVYSATHQRYEYHIWQEEKGRDFYLQTSIGTYLVHYSDGINHAIFIEPSFSGVYSSKVKFPSNITDFLARKNLSKKVKFAEGLFVKSGEVNEVFIREKVLLAGQETYVICSFVPVERAKLDKWGVQLSNGANRQYCLGAKPNSALYVLGDLQNAKKQLMQEVKNGLIIGAISLAADLIFLIIVFHLWTY